MKRLVTALSILGLAAASPAAALAVSGNQTNAATCPIGKLMVNVTYTVTNDPDSAYGNYNWAVDTVDRHLQVWQVGDGQYCAVVSDNGKFVTTGDGDPAGLGAPLDAGIKGVMDGGYTTGVYSSSFNADPGLATKGDLGSFDVSVRPSILSYTPGWDSNSEMPYWSWSYHTSQNGNWTDASNIPGGSSGDITN